MDNTLLVLACALASLIWWVGIPARAVWNDRRLGALPELTAVEPDAWPLVSVLVPARNEQAGIADAVQSLLEVDYPALEILLIDDRSSDRTGEIVDRLARQDPRIRALHIDALPAGWLGKVHALHRGIAASTGDWLLFTDADIHFSPATLKRAITHCRNNQLGFLSLLPRFRDTGLIIGSAQTALGTILLSLMDFARISDPASPLAMGVGAFNLVQRSYVDRGDGLEWLRLEVADDAGLALMAKNGGARIDVVSGQDAIEVDWYPTLAALQDGVMQRFIMGANYYLALFLLQCLAVGLCLFAPILLVSKWPMALPVLGFYAMPWLILGAGLRNFEIPRKLLAGLPLGFGVIAWGMLRALLTCIWRGGLYWRGNVYPLRELRASRRVRVSTFFGLGGPRKPGSSGAKRAE